jgi:hypothetical protein
MDIVLFPVLFFFILKRGKMKLVCTFPFPILQKTATFASSTIKINTDMKHTFALMLSLYLVCLPALSQPCLTLEKSTFSLGQIEWKKPASVAYTLTNTGNKPLVLTNITASCGCIAVDWTQSPIEPEGKGTINLTFDAKLLGYFNKSIGIYSNASPALTYLHITGEVVIEKTEQESNVPVSAVSDALSEESGKNTAPSIHLSQTNLTFDSSSRKAYNVVITNEGKSLLRIGKVQASHPNILKVQLKQTKIRSGKTTKLSISLQKNSMAPPDKEPMQILLETNDPVRPVVVVNVEVE